MSKRILVIFTGGTIGSAVKDGYISPDGEKGYRLIEEYRRISPYSLIYSGIDTRREEDTDNRTLQIDTIEPYRILSENMNGDYINQLIDCVRTYVTAPDDSIDITDTTSETASSATSTTMANSTHPHFDYDGIIITHGTDTLQYTSAALGYAFADADIPIVMVSSNYILDDARANGLDNFYYAVEFITGQHGNGVFISYRNGDSTQLVHQATRALPHLPYDDMLYSVGYKCYGEFTGTAFSLTVQDSASKNADTPCTNVSGEISKTTQEATAPETTTQAPALPYSSTHLSPDAPLLYIRPMPGLSYPTIDIHIKAILLDSYHSGTINTADRAIYDFMDEAKSREIPVFLTGAENRTGYESTKVYTDLGIHVLPQASPIAMYMKLWFICSRNNSDNNTETNKTDIIQEMYTPYAQDFIYI